ncbi:MAG: putative Thioredoxin-disulfide reductase [Verrucomicrobiales bacterium]|nr:putative Thioredoxin-disulfide reductase [Verrucomicrobiales bacterium]
MPLYSDIPEPMEPKDAAVPSIRKDREVIIVGGGLAGISAAIYLGRALRDVLVIDAGESLALWEPEAQNYLGFPSISGAELLDRGRKQARGYGAEFVKDEICKVCRQGAMFVLDAVESTYRAKRLLLATGVYHLPPKIPESDACIGRSMFFCKDCDGYRVQNKRVVVVGANDSAAEYALGILLYSPHVMIATNGQVPHWDVQHTGWIAEYEIPVYQDPITCVEHKKGHIECIQFGEKHRIAADCLFTTRGDVFHNKLAQELGAELDAHGQVVVDKCQRTNVAGLYAAGCVTPANCQMIIAAGNGATAAQAINRDLFEESLASHSLRNLREKQLQTAETEPHVLAS